MLARENRINADQINADWVQADWVQKVKQYRLAVDAYCDAYCNLGGRTDRGGDPDQMWQQIEVAHDEAERARAALLRQRRQPRFAFSGETSAHIRSLVSDEVSAYQTEELVLGDLGQLGG